jgi:hypothetical protein
MKNNIIDSEGVGKFLSVEFGTGESLSLRLCVCKTLYSKRMQRFSFLYCGRSAAVHTLKRGAKIEGVVKQRVNNY